MLRLSVLDQSIAVSGQSQGESIRQTLALAAHCERLGYSRFWVSEHHNHQTIVGTAPEILMSAIAATTNRIRVGSAGVMLPHYSSLKVAEQFRVLEAIAPGRIDLGVGRAPGSDGRTAFALNPNAATAAEQFPAQIRDVMAWLTGAPLSEGHPFGTIKAHPAGETSPEIWVLGTSNYGAQVAAFFGLPYSFAHFITDGQGTDQALAIYRENFRPSERFPEPIASVCVWALAAEAQEQAEHLFASRALWKIGRDKGRFLSIEPPDVAASRSLEAHDLARWKALHAQALIGSPEQLGEKLRRLAEGYGVDELVILTWTHDLAARQRSYELLAEEFALNDQLA